MGLTFTSGPLFRMGHCGQALTALRRLNSEKAVLSSVSFPTGWHSKAGNRPFKGFLKAFLKANKRHLLRLFLEVVLMPFYRYFKGFFKDHV